MLPYWLVFAVFAIGAMLHGERPGTVPRSAPFFALAMAGLAMFIGLRYQVGPDWLAYAYIFQGTQFWTLARVITRDDPGYYLLNWAVHRLDGELWLVNLVCASLFCAGLFAFSRRQWNPWLSALVAFPYLGIVVSMSGTRQSAAIGLFCLALIAFKDKSFIRFIIYITIASLFHASAILMAPICSLSYSRNKVQSVAIVLFGIALGYFVLSSSFDTYMNRYAFKQVQSSGAAVRIAMCAASALLFLCFKSRFEVQIHEKRLWKNMSYVAIACVPLLLVVPSSTALDRFILYIFPLQSFVFSRIPFLITSTISQRRLSAFAVVAYAAAIQAVYLNLSQFGAEYIPYDMFFINGETTYKPRAL